MKEDRLIVSALMTMNKNMFNVVLDNFMVFTKKKVTVWQVVVKTVKFIFNQRANRWSDSLKVGLMIPIHKKGPRDATNNYRGVVLLAMRSRILARIIASRLRAWEEGLELLD